MCYNLPDIMKSANKVDFFRVAIWLVTMLALVHCAPSKKPVLVPSYQLLPVDDSYRGDSLAEATIAPYRHQLATEMDVVIGHSNKRLTEQELESLLGNFVADAILSEGSHYYDGTIHMSVINNGGLRAPIPEGPVKISNIYELMPFENVLYILELNGSQTKALFDLLASTRRVAIANSVVIIENDKPVKIFIDGTPFREDSNYVLAVSDYLAQGGGGMEFLKDAKVLSVEDIKIRDLIIDHIARLDSIGQPVDAEIEGRVRLIP